MTAILENLVGIVRDEATKLDPKNLANLHQDTFRNGIAKLFTASAASEPGDQPKPIPDTIAETILVPLDLGEIVLAATDGTATIAKAMNTFKGHISDDFKDYGTDKPSGPTSQQAVTCYEPRKDATHADMFGSLGNDLDKLCLTQGQIIDFCKNHPDKLLLEECSNLFLFKVGAKYFVARVRVSEFNLLEAHVYRFESPGVWHTNYRRRVVVPQLQA